MAIVIKKRASLGFLGDEYKEAYLDFRSIPIKDLDEITKAIPKDEADNEKVISTMLDTLKKYFIAGEFPEDSKLVPVNKEDLDDLNIEAAMNCFQVLTGTLDPKSQGQSTTQSSTAVPPPEN